MKKDIKRKRGDRKDGYLVKETDPLHAISPYILPNRTDNEAVLTETVDMTKVIACINDKNADNPSLSIHFFILSVQLLPKLLHFVLK